MVAGTGEGQGLARAFMSDVCDGGRTSVTSLKTALAVIHFERINKYLLRLRVREEEREREGVCVANKSQSFLHKWLHGQSFVDLL